MPSKPNKGEKQGDFHSRCMKQMTGEGKDQDQANAACFAMWKKRGASESAHPADAMISEASTTDWSMVDRTRLPASCFLWVDDPQKKGTWHFPVYEGAGGIDPKTGMYREAGELNLWALRAANAGARSGRMKVPASVKARLESLSSLYEGVSRYDAYRTPVLQESADPSRLVEAVKFDGAEFVEEGGKRIVKNVVMLGPVSSHGYEYKQEAMSKAVQGGMYEGVRIFINHAKEGRDLMHLAGVFREARHEDGKVRGNAHLLDDDYGRKFWNIAKTMPEAAGCSHVADGKLVKEGEKKYVEEITRVHSVDLVVQGATTKNVFEGESPDNRKDPAMEWKDVRIEDLKTARPDLAHLLIQEGAKTRDEEIQALISEKQTLVSEKETLTGDKGKLTEQIKQLQAKIDEATVLEATRQKEAVVVQAMADLPEQARTPLFKEQCMAVTTGKDGFDAKVFEAKVADLIKDRKALCEQGGVRNMGGDQTRGKDTKALAEEANAALTL